MRLISFSFWEKFDIPKNSRTRRKAVVLRKLTDMKENKEIQYKGIARAVECKEDAEKGILHIKAYALAFDNVDLICMLRTTGTPPIVLHHKQCVFS